MKTPIQRIVTTLNKMNDPYDDDYRAPWNDEERPKLGYLEEADYHEEHNEQ